jgi:membrane-associated phospholipid phosphatase
LVSRRTFERAEPAGNLPFRGPRQRVRGYERRRFFEVSTVTGRSVVALWVTLVFAGSILALMARGAGPLVGDLTLTRWLQESLPPEGLMGSLLTYTGRLVWVLPIAFLAVALLRQRWLAALFVLVAAVTGLLLGDALKLLVTRSRPSAELVQVYEPSEGHGFPSTTALLAVVLLGAVCYLVWLQRPRRPVLAALLCAFLLSVLASGISRVRAGEHWATDVLGGWLFGSAWLLILIVIHRQWFSRQGRPRMPR